MYLKIVLIIAAIAAVGLAVKSHAASPGLPPLKTVDRVDLSRYVGTWYEIARLPNSFQEGCIGSRAEYTLRDDGEIDVRNSCRDAKDNRIREAKGRAWSVDPVNNTRLKVSFFWPFRGDYWILELGKEYEYVVVGTPSRKYLWVLSRTPVMDDALFSDLMNRIERQGFDAKQIVRH